MTEHRHTKSAHRLPDNEIGITLGGTKYVMPISEANELVGMICAARHAEPVNWAGTVPEASPRHPLVFDEETRLFRAATQADIHRFEHIALKYKSLHILLKEISDAP